MHLPPPSSTIARKQQPATESRAKTKTSVYLNGNSPIGTNSNGHSVHHHAGYGTNNSSARRASIPPTLQRKTSRNSLSSNSSVSSQTTEDSLSSNGLLKRRGPLVHHRHPSVVADVMSPLDESPYFLLWKLRKREEKKLRERRSYLEQRMRRH